MKFPTHWRVWSLQSDTLCSLQFDTVQTHKQVMHYPSATMLSVPVEQQKWSFHGVIVFVEERGKTQTCIYKLSKEALGSRGFLSRPSSLVVRKYLTFRADGWGEGSLGSVFESCQSIIAGLGGEREKLTPSWACRGEHSVTINILLCCFLSLPPVLCTKARARKLLVDTVTAAALVRQAVMKKPIILYN